MAKLDRKLVAREQQYEVSYFARKHQISTADARSILQRAGRSRENANALARSEREAETSRSIVQDEGRSSGYGRYPTAHKPRSVGGDKSSGYGRPRLPLKPQG